MFFLLYWTLKAIAYFLMALAFVAYLVGLVAWTVLRVTMRVTATLVLRLLARGPRAARDQDALQSPTGEDQVPVRDADRVGVDDGGLTPALSLYLVDRH
jgi:hypothetical protein